jgi:hypothetical protein
LFIDRMAQSSAYFRDISICPVMYIFSNRQYPIAWAAVSPPQCRRNTGSGKHDSLVQNLVRERTEVKSTLSTLLLGEGLPTGSECSAERTMGGIASRQRPQRVVDADPDDDLVRYTSTASPRTVTRWGRSAKERRSMIFTDRGETHQTRTASGQSGRWRKR